MESWGTSSTRATFEGRRVSGVCLRTLSAGRAPSRGVARPRHSLKVRPHFRRREHEWRTFATTETMFIIGVRFVSAQSGQVISRLVACPSQGLSKDGHSTSCLIKDALKERPLGITSRRLRAGLVAVGGDGQLAAGGPQAKHSSTKAAEILWKSVHPASMLLASYWDSYHRGETAMRWSFNTRWQWRYWTSTKG